MPLEPFTDNRASAGAEIVAVHPVGQPHLLPIGDCQIAWSDHSGIASLLDVVSWRRLDQGPMIWGQEFTVTLQARASRDLRLPMYSATGTFVLTLDPGDVHEVVVGDVTRPGGWMMGVRLIGARPASRLLPADQPRS